MKSAAIDIGTNSIRLLVADLTPDQSYLPLARRAVITRLGEGVNENKVLSNDAILRSIRVLQEYVGEIEKYRVERVWVVGTSALREARDSDNFLKRIREAFGWQVEILPGEREAELSFLGATAELSGLEKDVLVIDIGGGSTELILGLKNKIKHFCSLDMGCVRLTEMFVRSDPPLPQEVEAMEKYIQRKIGEAPQALWSTQVSNAVGLAGTITTLSAIKQKMQVYDSGKIHGSLLTLEEIQEILRMLLSLALDQRKQVVGLEPGRADVVVAGIKILIELMKRAGLDQIAVSERDILDGILLSKVM